MSLEIYNGYKIDADMSAYSLNNLMTKISKDCQKICDDLYHIEVAKFVSLCLDTKMIYGEEKMNDVVYSNYKYKPSKFANNLFSYIQELVEQHSKSNSILQDNFDFKCQVKLIPLKEKILCLLYTEKQEYKDLFGYVDIYDIEHCSKKYPNISPYIFYNHTDKPKNISEKDWDIRKQEWNHALKQNGFIYNLTKSPFRYNVDILIKKIEAIYEYRIENLASNKVKDLFNEDNKYLIKENDFYDYLIAFTKYTKSDKYNKDLELTKEEIKKIIPIKYSYTDFNEIKLKTK